MSSNSQQFTIKASDETLKHNLLKINGPIVNLESIPSISISRLVETTEEDTDESKLDIKVGGVKFDASKVAPSAAALKKVNYFQKKNRQFFYGRERGQGDDKDDGIEGISLSQKKTKDPDTLPYIMTTNNNHVYEGSLEDQTSSYMLFIAQDSGFKAIPLSKYYKFNQKTTYNRLTIEEAELRLNGSKRKQELGQDRWFMKSHQKEDGQEDVVPIKVEKKFKIADSGGNAEDEELDFEEDFQDDDGLMELGFEDQEFEKEAKTRAYGGKATASKRSFEDFDQKDKSLNTLDKSGRRLKKSLVKIEKNELFDDDSEDENPYASEEDEDEIEIERLLNLKDEKKIVPPVVVPPVIEKSTSNQSTGPDTKNLKRKPDDPVGLFHKKQKKVEGASMNKYPGASRYSRETSPQPSSSPRSPIPSTSSISSRIKLKIGSTSAFSHDGAPLPPTAAEVLAKETEKRKRKSIASADNLVDQQIKRPGSPSTSHGSASPRSDGGQSPIKQNLQYLGAPQEIKSEVIQPNSAQQSPYSTGANSPDPDKLDTQLQVEVIEILGKNPNISVPTLVTFIKPHFKNAEYKSIFKGVLKNVLKRTCTFEKGSGLLNLKK